MPPREEFHNKSPRPPSGFERVGETLTRTSRGRRTKEDTEAYEAIREYIRDYAGQFNDTASLKSSTTRAFRLYKQSGRDLSEFFNLLYDATAETKRRTASITKHDAQGFKSKMAYFFAVLEDVLGLRETPLPDDNPSP